MKNFQPKIAANKPKVVPTPLPPLNLSQIGKMWPIMGDRVIISFMGREKSLRLKTTKTNKYDFKKSKRPTKKPLDSPNLRKTLVAPMLPLPNWRMSFFFDLLKI